MRNIKIADAIKSVVETENGTRVQENTTSAGVLSTWHVKADETSSDVHPSLKRGREERRRKKSTSTKLMNYGLFSIALGICRIFLFSLSPFFKLPYQSLHYLSVCVRTCIFESLSFSSSSSFSFSYFSICFLRCKWRACYINEATDVPLIATCDKPSSSRRRT